uniref:Uncharacterized protein n=1 Tax=Globisporangium ultimum (strain ATCC 200006 / CBS 805.95 / DAOM BR144) TaxID=431595 RepID=K3WWZ2_GLOUD
MSRLSKHFVGEKVKALCFVKDVRSSEAHEQYEFLPLVAAGGWDTEVNHVTLHLPILPTRDESELRREFGRIVEEPRPCELSQVAEVVHHGDVNALQFVATKGENLLFTASSNGSVFCFRVSDSSSPNANGMSDEIPVATSDSPLAPFAIPQWENLFHGSAVTCLDASESKTSLVAASESGGVAWLRLDNAMSTDKIVNKDSSNLRINGIKVLGRDSIVATVGSAPGSQLRIWDIAANQSFPVMTASDSHMTTNLTTVETHPTRPELLITGSDDGRVSFWDQRRLDAPFRTESKHQRAVRALKLHSASPRYLYSGGDDATVLSWDFHHGRHPRDAVEYDKHALYSSSSTSIVSHDRSGLSNGSSNHSAAGGVQVQPMASGFLPWNAVDLHAESDTLVAGSDAQSILVVQHASKFQQELMA